MSDRDPAAEVAQAFSDYLAAFETADVSRINRYVHYPLTILLADGTTTVDAYPEDPNRLKQETGWHTTADADFEVVGATPDKAHVLLKSARRLRVDGSLIETIAAFYAFARFDDRWRFFALSGLTVAPDGHILTAGMPE